MIWIERITVYVAAPDGQLRLGAKLLISGFSIMARCALRFQTVERWIRHAARRLNRDDMTDRSCRLNALLFETCLAQRIYL